MQPLDPARPPRSLATPGSIDELAAKAGAGDAVAACQLAAELAACRTNQTLRRFRTDSSLPRATARCDELLARHRDRHFDWLRQAAHAGEPEAMLRYATGEAFGMHGASFDYLRSPHFDTWRREAPAMLQALVEAGYPEAVLARIRASNALMGGPLANAIEPDAVQDRAYGELLVLLNDRFVDLVGRRLPPPADDVVDEQAKDLAMRWHQDYFGGRRLDFGALPSGSGFPVMRAHGANCSVAVDEAGR